MKQNQHAFKVTFCWISASHACSFSHLIYFLFRSGWSLYSWRIFPREQCSCFAEIKDQTWLIKLLSGFYPRKSVFQAKQQPLGKVMGATWPEWGIRALVDVLPIETCSVTYQQALQSPIYSMFKCCVNIAFALLFIFVSLLPRCCQTMLEATAGLSVQACTGAHLPASWLKRSGGENGLANEKQVLRFTESVSAGLW